MGVTGGGDQSLDKLHWSELNKGDRVRHFEYGVGTVDSASGLFVYITWDDPKVGLNHHAASIVQHLTRA